ncbi:MAG: hypothetical protein AAFX96_09815, partial [Pseudomonadota bacterium]
MVSVMGISAIDTLPESGRCHRHVHVCEAGTIGSCPSVMNAVVDALDREYGITDMDMPVTPSRLWKRING